MWKRRLLLFDKRLLKRCVDKKVAALIAVCAAAQQGQKLRAKGRVEVIIGNATVLKRNVLLHWHAVTQDVAITPATTSRLRGADDGLVQPVIRLPGADDGLDHMTTVTKRGPDI